MTDLIVYKLLESKLNANDSDGFGEILRTYKNRVDLEDILTNMSDPPGLLSHTV